VSLATLAQDSGGASERDGHFVDDFIDLITNLDAGQSVFDFFADLLEWAVRIGVWVIPAAILLGGLSSRRWSSAAGGGALLAFVGYYTWYTGDGKQEAVVESGRTPVTDNVVLDNWVIPVGDWVEQTTRWVDLNMFETLAVIKWPFEVLLQRMVNDWLVGMSWVTFCLAIFFVGWAIRNVRVGAVSFLGLAMCGLLGDEYWEQTARTIGFIAVAVLLCVIIGIPIGIASGRIDGVWTVVRPVLDAMQVVHSFVYMLPFIFFFGIGPVSATMVTMVFALPPLIRLTNLGIRQVPEDVVEAARAYGAPEWRVLVDVQLPLARPAIMTGLNQNLLLSISMLGIAAIMGAGGLGSLLFRAISNVDIALAASAGLAFFLVAVVLDRLSQPETGDGTNLFGRIAQAWATRKSPEKALEQSEAMADAARAAKQIEKPKVIDRYKQAEGMERSLIFATAGGSILALISLFLPWTKDGGLVSAFGRRADESLSGSFSGLDASGGSWFGILLGIATVVSLLSCFYTLFAPGKHSRWLSADGAAITMGGGLVMTVMHLLINAPDTAVDTSTGIGVYLAIIGSAVATVAAVRWTWINPVTARTPLEADIAWGRVLVTGFAVVTMVAGAYSGWTYDTRADSVITPELQAQLDAIQEEARIAEADGDLGLAGALAAELTAKISEAQRTGDIVYDGFTDEGAGLGIPLIILTLAAVGLTLFGAGAVGSDEWLRYRWSTLVSAVGAGIVMTTIGWIATLARVADPNLVSGVGSAMAAAAGFFILASGLNTIRLFLRNKVYDGGEDTVAEPQPGPTPEPVGADA